MKKIILISSLTLMFAMDGISQSASNSNGNPDEPRQIEKTTIISQKQLDFFKKELEFKVLESNKEKRLYKKEIELILQEYRQEKTILDWIAIGVGSFTFISLIGLLYNFWLKVKDMAQKKIEDRFEVILQEKKGQLIKIINSQDDEEKLKRNKRIRVVTSYESDVSFLNSFFRKFDFKHIEVIEVNEVSDATLEDDNYDILFLNREEGNSPLKDDVSKKLIADLPKDSIVFSFGEFIRGYDEKVKKRFAAATNWSQLYGNLISALKYQELIDLK